MTRRVLFEGSQDIIIRYKIYNARVYPSEVELSDCIRLGVFLFLGLRSFSLRRNKEKECKCRVRGCISPDKKNIFVFMERSERGENPVVLEKQHGFDS